MIQILLGITWLIVGIYIFKKGVEEEHPSTVFGYLLIVLGVIVLLMNTVFAL